MTNYNVPSLVPGRILLHSTFAQGTGTGLPDPTRWTNSNGDTGFVVDIDSSIRLRLRTGAAADRNAQVWVTQQRWPANIGMLALMESNGSSHTARFSLRANAVEGNEGFPTNGYILKITPDTIISLNSVLNNTETELVNTTLTGLTTNSLYWVRFECVGNQLIGRVWRTADRREPPGVTDSGATARAISITDDTYPNAGMVQCHVQTPDATNRNVYIHQFILYEPRTVPNPILIVRGLLDPYVPQTRSMDGKQGTSDSAKATRFNTTRPIAAKAATSSSAKATLRTTRPISVKIATADSSKGIIGIPKRFAVASVATSNNAKAVLGVGRLQSLAAKAATTTNAKATFLNVSGSVRFSVVVPTTSSMRLRKIATPHSGQTRTLQVRAPTTSSFKGAVKGNRKVVAKVSTASKAKGTLTYSRKYVGKAGSSTKAKATLSTTTGGGNPPAIPGNITAATPASLVIGWGGGGGNYAGEDMATFQSWRNWGPRGVALRMGNNFLYTFGGGQNSRGTTALGLPGGEWNYQKQFEGQATIGSSNGGAFKAKQNGIIDYVSINVKLTHTNYFTSWGGPTPTPPPGGATYNSDSNGAPWAQWWDDTVWANVCARVGERAAMVNYLDGDALHFDPEDQGRSNWNTGRGYHITSGSPDSYFDNGIPTGGHSVAEQVAKIEQRGFEFGSAIYQNFPNCDIIIYQWQDIEAAWQATQGARRLGRIWHYNYYLPNSPSNHSLFFYGILRAHQVFNSQGKFLVSDAWWYRGSPQWPGVSTTTALLWDSQGTVSTISRGLSDTVRNQVMPFVGWWPMSWAGCDTSAGTQANQETEPLWTNNQKLYHDYGMFGMRVEYNYDGQFLSNAQYGFNAGFNNYSGTGPGINGRLAAWVPSFSTASHNSTLPTVGSISQSRNGNTVTLTFTATHPFGLQHVKWKLYATNGTTVLGSGAAKMLWRPSSTTTVLDHDPALGIANQYQECTCIIPNATSGLYVIVDVFSASAQRTSRRVQMT